MESIGNLTIEFELVNSDTDCLVNPGDNAEANAVGDRFTNNVALPAGNASSTSTAFELSMPSFPVRLVLWALDGNSDSEKQKYVQRLPEGKGLPFACATYITQSQAVAGISPLSIYDVNKNLEFLVLLGSKLA